MVAYTGIETISNLAEEAKDYEKTVPAATKLVVAAVFAIYLFLPAIALSAMPVENGVTLLGLTEEEGGFAGDPVLGIVENMSLGIVPACGRDLRRNPRRDDSLHRHQRRHHRRLAPDLQHGPVPPGAGGAAQRCTRSTRRRTSRSSSSATIACLTMIPGQAEFLGDDVRLRRDAQLHDRAPRGDQDAARRIPITQRPWLGPMNVQFRDRQWPLFAIFGGAGTFDLLGRGRLRSTPSTLDLRRRLDGRRRAVLRASTDAARVCR